MDFRVFASCHNHSTFSDGEWTPETLARAAKCMGHGGIILTDHDTTRGYRRMKAAGGVPVVAHPKRLEKYADFYIELGVMGFETRHSMLSPELHRFFEDLCDRHGLYKMGGADHENVLGGLLTFDNDDYVSPYETSGIDEESFMKIYERRLG